MVKYTDRELVCFYSLFPVFATRNAVKITFKFKFHPTSYGSTTASLIDMPGGSVVYHNVLLKKIPKKPKLVLKKNQKKIVWYLYSYGKNYDSVAQNQFV